MAPHYWCSANTPCLRIFVPGYSRFVYLPSGGWYAPAKWGLSPRPPLPSPPASRVTRTPPSLPHPRSAFPHFSPGPRPPLLPPPPFPPPPPPSSSPSPSPCPSPSPSPSPFPSPSSLLSSSSSPPPRSPPPRSPPPHSPPGPPPPSFPASWSPSAPSSSPSPSPPSASFFPVPLCCRQLRPRLRPAPSSAAPRLEVANRTKLTFKDFREFSFFYFF